MWINEYFWYHKKFDIMLSLFEKMWDGNKAQIKTVQRQIELEKNDIRLIQSGGHWGKVQDFKMCEIDWVIIMNVVEPAQKECTSRIVSLRKKDRNPWFFVDYQKFGVNGDLGCVPYSLHGRMYRLTSQYNNVLGIGYK